MIFTLWNVAITKRLRLNPAQDDKALDAAWDEVRLNGNWDAAAALMAGTRQNYDLRTWYASVLGESTIRAMRDQAEPGTGRVGTDAAWTDRWAAADPGNPDALLVRAASLIERAWEVRGGGWASTVGREQWVEFFRILDLALTVNTRAVDAAPDDPAPWADRLTILLGRSADRDAYEAVWQEVVARDPHHRRAHAAKLAYLCRKWKGSHEEMFGFARETAAAAPAGSPLHVLPVRAAAEWALWEQTRAEDSPGPDGISERWRADERLQAELTNALENWFRRPAARHATFRADANTLAYGLCRSGRHAEAWPVFQAIGPYLDVTTWAWWGIAPGPGLFLKQKKLAKRAAS